MFDEVIYHTSGLKGNWSLCNTGSGISDGGTILHYFRTIQIKYHPASGLSVGFYKPFLFLTLGKVSQTICFNHRSDKKDNMHNLQLKSYCILDSEVV